MAYPMYDELDHIMMRFGKKQLNTITTKTMKNTTEVPNELLIEAHKEASRQVAEKIEKIAPELFKPKLKVGNWVFSKRYGVGRIVSLDSFGDPRVDFGEMTTIFFKDNLRLATPSEIESHLIKEAEKRGFKIGVKIDSLWGSKCQTIRVMRFKYRCTDKQDVLFLDGHAIYDEGKWATIIPQEEVEISMDEIAKWKNVDVKLIKIKK